MTAKKQRVWPALSEARRLLEQGAESATHNSSPKSHLRSKVRNPKRVGRSRVFILNPFETQRWKIVRGITQICEVREIAHYGAMPAVQGKNSCYGGILVFSDIERKHGKMLRGSWRGDRLQD